MRKKVSKQEVLIRLAFNVIVGLCFGSMFGTWSYEYIGLWCVVFGVLMGTACGLIAWIVEEAIYLLYRQAVSLTTKKKMRRAKLIVEARFVNWFHENGAFTITFALSLSIVGIFFAIAWLNDWAAEFQNFLMRAF